MFRRTCLIILFFISFLWPVEKSNLILKGSGATFPYPLYQKWIQEYAKISDVKIIYEPVGSGQGIADLLNNRVDFGGTDVFLNDEELQKFKDKVIHIPTCIGAIVFTYNLPINKPLNLSKKTMMHILTGKIKNWNAPIIQDDNPGLKLPDRQITLIHRSDDSGSTYVLTSYLSKISNEWKKKYGFGKNFQWELGIGVEGNENIAKYIQKIPGSIGYISFTYAKRGNLPIAMIENENGNFILPTVHSITKAAETIIPDDVRTNLVASKNKESYPISTFSYVIYTEKKSPETTETQKLKAGKELFKWMLTEGQKYNEEYFYAPIPKNVTEKIFKNIK